MTTPLYRRLARLSLLALMPAAAWGYAASEVNAASGAASAVGTSAATTPADAKFAVATPAVAPNHHGVMAKTEFLSRSFRCSWIDADRTIV